MSFGVQRETESEAGRSDRKIVKAITTETIVGLVVVIALLAAFASQMGLAHM